MQSEVELSVVLPILNERENIPPLLAELHGVLLQLGRSFEVVAVDDGSTDGSREALISATETYPHLKVIIFRKNSGQTASFDAGFKNSVGRFMVTMDADLQNDPKDIPIMLKLLEEQNLDFVAGWRKNRQDDLLLRKIPSLIANRIIRMVTGTTIHDLGCSLKVYRKEITDELHLFGEMHRFIGVLIEGMGAKVGEVVVNHRPRVAGVSKYNLTRTIKVLLDLMTIWFMRGYSTKPIYVFGFMGLSLLGLGMVSTVTVAIQKFIFEIWVHDNPLFIVGIFFFLMGAMFLAIGLLAEITIRIYFTVGDSNSYSILRKVGFKNQEQQLKSPAVLEA